MDWVWIVGAAWVLLAAGLAPLIGRSIGLADRKAAGIALDAPNFIVDRPPLPVLPGRPEGVAHDGLSVQNPAPEDSPRPARHGIARDAPTIPGIPAARPPIGRPPVPRSTHQRRPRRTGLG
ncbi:MAG: hypothetical protein JWQ45_1505 [Blastococcus sp.]|nr:hypothetical protein [Blastococcus sp.]